MAGRIRKLCKRFARPSVSQEPMQFTGKLRAIPNEEWEDFKYLVDGCLSKMTPPYLGLSKEDAMFETLSALDRDTLRLREHPSPPGKLSVSLELTSGGGTITGIPQNITRH